MPWNYPLWQVIRFAAPGLMAGNTGLLKHASSVPQTALYLGELFERAGFPKGSFQTLLIEGKAASALIDDRRIRAVTLTGSVGAGASVADYWQITDRPRNVTYIRDGNADGYYDLICELYARLP